MSGEGKRRFSLMRSGALISALTFVSRIFGFIRDQLMAITFGAGGLMDAFYLAFALPNFFRRIFGEGAFSQAFVPVFNDVKEQSSHQRLRELCASVSGTLAVFVFGLAVLGVIFAEPILSVVAPGLSATPEREHAAAIMLRWTFPYLAFISLVAYAGGVLNSYGKFGVPAFTPVLLNICLIGAIFLSVYYDGPGEYVLAVGVFVAGFAQLALQLPALSKLGLLPMPTLDFKDQGVRRILVLMAPAIFGASVYQVNMLFSRFIASFLPDGSFSWLYNADRLVEFPLGIFGVALATVVLPVLSRQNSAGDQAGRTETYRWGAHLTLIIALPSAVGLAILAEPLFWTLFTYGRFTPADASASAAALVAYSLALPAYALLKIQSAAFFSAQNTKTPVKIGVITMVANMVFSAAFVYLMIEINPAYQHVGLAIASVCSAWLNCVLLQVRLIDVMPERRMLPGGAGFFVKLIIAAVVMALAVDYLANMMGWLEYGVGQRLWHLLLCVVGGALVYLLSLLIMGIRPKQFSR